MRLNYLSNYGEPWQLGFQSAGSPIMEEIIFFHDQILFVLAIILITVMGLLYRAFTIKMPHQGFTEGGVVEVIWTLIPAAILIGIAFPSLKLLYMMEEELGIDVTVKAVGHQWYWSYEHTDFSGEVVEVESYMVNTADLSPGDQRLLEVDNKLIVPMGAFLRVLVTGADVLHSFAVPALAVKMDAVPGRLNQVYLMINRPGVFYGQCSEICGANHSFMPIVVESVSLLDYCTWLQNQD